MFSKTQI